MASDTTLNDRFMKRRRRDDQASPVQAAVDASEPTAQHRVGTQIKVPGLIVTDHYFKVPFDHSGEVEGDIELFAREVVAPGQARRSIPYLLYLQGGPGFESPRPTEASTWLKVAVNHFRVILMDQRGTGKSSQITLKNLGSMGTPEQQTAYLQYFRADSIVKDAELVRKSLVPQDNHHGKWSILGQSFGGFCVVSYLSIAPQGVLEALITAGLPPGIDQPCSAEAAYRALAQRVLAQNKKYYNRFPQDITLVQDIVTYLESQPDGGARLPSGTLLTPRVFQMLGMSGLGSGGGFERLHFLLEGFFDDQQEISASFIKQFENWMPWDTNPLYVLLHESIYCQGEAANWAAHRVLETDFKDAFDASGSAQKGQPVLFTGEMVFPWMFEDFGYLKPFKETADLLAAKSDWGPLYNLETLEANTVPVVAATYVEDMFVDFNLAQDTASHIQGIHQWMTNEYKHSGIRDDGFRIFDRLLNMVRGTILVD